MSTEGARKWCSVAVSPLMAVMRAGLAGADVIIAGVKHIKKELNKYENEYNDVPRRYRDGLSRVRIDSRSWASIDMMSLRTGQQPASEQEHDR